MPTGVLFEMKAKARRDHTRIAILSGLISLCLFFACLDFTHIGQLSTEGLLSLVFAEILALLVLTFFAFKRRLGLFEPVTLFSAYYVTIVPVALYYLFTDFGTSIIVNSTSFRHSTDRLLMTSMIYYVVGYACMLIGYYVTKTKRPIAVHLEDRRVMPNGVLNIFIGVFLIIGLVNFAYNVQAISGGNVIDYVANTAGRDYEFEGKGLTTIGYHFAWVAIYVWFFKVLRQNRITVPFLLFALVGFVMKVSTGRITSTLVFLGSFVVIYYFVSPEKPGESSKDKKYLLFLVSLAGLGIIFYFLRILSALRYQGIFDLQAVEQFMSFENFAYLAIDRGNVPHIPILMKIIDSWGEDIGFLYGRSFVTWILSIVPTGIVDPNTYLISLKIKNAWFSHLIGAGGLPPTGVGEGYANFGPVGPFFGMFLFGAFCGVLYNWAAMARSYWVLVVYSQVLLGFIAIYPKTDFANCSPWYIVPILLTAAALKATSYFGKILARRDSVAEPIRTR
ncbi:MAG: hypothetical protein A4E63_02103 [Syntrophorhabdus sp. PtaU1.Bin050]|nr:MAG: hypothetical protein A4E63_02103 [Syntrophorhabdus sp. PtaU1.Bin050]